jgi:putative transposase
MGKRRGQLTTGSERQTILSLVKEATDAGARQKMACEMIGISAKTQQRWSQSSNDKDGRIEAPHSPQNKLTALERQRILKVVNEPDFAHLPASQIVPRLADKGIYIGSESTIYRILKEEKQLQHRLKSKPARKIIKPKALTAIAPNQVYTWDITYLPTRVKGTFFYLYLVLDIFSRKIVGWQVHCDELSALAADLMTDICLREKVKRHQVTLHSDNGSPMKGATMLATLQELGVMPSFSRPSVSNDNPYSESIFRTLKYRPEYPEKAFSDIDEARKWVTGFTKWYNEEHRHSGIKFVTPSERHQRIDDAILLNRVEVYNRAKAQNPSRWSGEIKNWDPIKEVNLNPEKSKIEIKENKAA